LCPRDLALRIANRDLDDLDEARTFVVRRSFFCETQGFSGLDDMNIVTPDSVGKPGGKEVVIGFANHVFRPHV
jgi:hypothetical protein